VDDQLVVNGAIHVLIADRDGAPAGGRNRQNNIFRRLS
jgi:hypothetical protein